jgi:hypothetical protein
MLVAEAHSLSMAVHSEFPTLTDAVLWLAHLPAAVEIQYLMFSTSCTSPTKCRWARRKDNGFMRERLQAQLTGSGLRVRRI